MIDKLAEKLDRFIEWVKIREKRREFRKRVLSYKKSLDEQRKELS